MLFYVISSKFESTTLGFSRKKSPWKHDIQPKCVSLNTRSIIQIMWPAVGPFEYIDCITTPMSAVDWWLQRRRTSSLEMSFKESPDSFTGKNNLSVTRDYSQITLLTPSLFRIYVGNYKQILWEKMYFEIKTKYKLYIDKFIPLGTGVYIYKCTYK